jgi:hypothetical protein
MRGSSRSLRSPIARASPESYDETQVRGFVRARARDTWSPVFRVSCFPAFGKFTREQDHIPRLCTGWCRRARALALWRRARALGVAGTLGMEGLPAFFSPPVPRPAPGVLGGPLARFADIAGALERAARAIARLDALLTGHPLEPAWLWRIRLEAVRRQAAIDGRVIDPWHLAAVIEGVRFRMDRAVAIIDRGAIFEAARHALGLWRWFAQPDAAQSEAIGCAAAGLAATEQGSPLLGAALGVRA